MSASWSSFEAPEGEGDLGRLVNSQPNIARPLNRAQHLTLARAPNRRRNIPRSSGRGARRTLEVVANGGGRDGSGSCGGGNGTLVTIRLPDLSLRENRALEGLILAGIRDETYFTHFLCGKTVLQAQAPLLARVLRRVCPDLIGSEPEFRIPEPVFQRLRSKIIQADTQWQRDLLLGAEDFARRILTSDAYVSHVALVDPLTATPTDQVLADLIQDVWQSDPITAFTTVYRHLQPVFRLDQCSQRGQRYCNHHFIAVHVYMLKYIRAQLHAALPDPVPLSWQRYPSTLPLEEEGVGQWTSSTLQQQQQQGRLADGGLNGGSDTHSVLRATADPVPVSAAQAEFVLPALQAPGRRLPVRDSHARRLLLESVREIPHLRPMEDVTETDFAIITSAPGKGVSAGVLYP